MLKSELRAEGHPAYEALRDALDRLVRNNDLVVRTVPELVVNHLFESLFDAGCLQDVKTRLVDQEGKVVGLQG